MPLPSELGAGHSAWQRWKRLAQRAAQMQSNILMTLLYYVAFVPMAVVRRPWSDRQFHGGGPEWRSRPEPDRSLRSVRRQF